MDKVNVSYRVDERLTIRGGYNREKKKDVSSTYTGSNWTSKQRGSRDQLDATIIEVALMERHSFAERAEWIQLNLSLRPPVFKDHYFRPTTCIIFLL